MPTPHKTRSGVMRNLNVQPRSPASRVMLVCFCIMLTFALACSACGGGSEQRASHDPANEWGSPDIYDDFSGTNPEFQLDNPAGVAHGWYADGRFNITYPAKGWWTWYSGSSSAMNFYVDVLVYNGDQCLDRDAVGLLYRYIQGSDSGLMFGVTCGGGYFKGLTGWLGAGNGVCLFTNANPSGPTDLDCSAIWEHPTSSHINDGPGAANRLGVLAQDNQITMYINGHEVDSITISPTVPQYGEFALYLGSTQPDNASASFDDFSVWLEPSEGP